MKKKGFTLVELLVVIAIIALLMGILMPALARVRQIAYRLYCGTNLSGLGKAMLIYAQDYDDELPRAGTKDGTWANQISNWLAVDAFGAYGYSPTDNPPIGNASIASTFFLLVKYAEVTPKSFLCKGDAGAMEFKLIDKGITGRNVVDVWNFGDIGQAHCSYAYHSPFGMYGLTTSSDPGMALAADPNPWQNQIDASAKTTWAIFDPDGDRTAVKAGNAQTHQDDGQNVLYVDGHTNFEKESFCGVDTDNIYTLWTSADPAAADRRKGTQITDPATQFPLHRNDSVLITDNGGKGRMCFPADTIVWVDGEMTEISKVVAGATVDKPALTKTITSLKKTVCSNEIEEVVVHDGSESYYCYDIVLENGNSLVVANSHYFLLDSGDWVVLQKLETGSRLQTLEGPVTIKSVTKRSQPSSGKVYNLKIKNSERYLVGKDGIVVRDW